MLDELVAEAGRGATAPELAPAEVRGAAGRPPAGPPHPGQLPHRPPDHLHAAADALGAHRVVCLLGLDDGAFPRKAPRDGDDLMLEHPQLGDRDPRSEDRQLLLDALLAATERLIVTYSGNDERTNAPRPPAVPVGELLDAIDATVRAEDGPARDRVVVRHPLQPFDPRNFTPGRIAAGTVELRPRRRSPGRARSPARDPSRARSSRRRCRPGHRPSSSSTTSCASSSIRSRAFLRQRLGISLYAAADEIEDELPVELDGLERWGVGQRLLDGAAARRR